MVPLVERRTARDALAMLGGVEYIAFDFAAPEDGLRQLAVHLAGLRQRKEREDQIVAMALLVCAVAIIVMSSGTSSA